MPEFAKGGKVGLERATIDAEKTGDGKMCAGRDILHSRTGAKCEIDRFRELVPER